MISTLLIVVAAVLGLDAGYDGIVHWRHARWEKTVERHADGLRVGYEPGTVGTGRVALLMIHGFAAGPITWGRMAPALAERGYTCRMLLLPGTGQPMETYARATQAQWRETIAQEVDQLRREHDQVWLVGHSLGGALAALEALDRPEHSNGLILLAPLFEVSSRRSPLLSARGWFEVVERITIFTDLTEMAFPVDIHDPEVAARVVRDQFVPRSIYRQLFAVTDALEGRAAALCLPVFLAYAPEDRVTDPDAATRFVAASGAVRKEIFCAQASGHVVPWDYGWETAVEHIDAFIRER